MLKDRLAKLFKSKTVWMGLVVIGAGVYEITNGFVDKGLERIGFGLTIIFGRDAIAKVENVASKVADGANKPK